MEKECQAERQFDENLIHTACDHDDMKPFGIIILHSVMKRDRNSDLYHENQASSSFAVIPVHNVRSLSWRPKTSSFFQLNGGRVNAVSVQATFDFLHQTHGSLGTLRVLADRHPDV